MRLLRERQARKDPAARRAVPVGGHDIHLEHIAIRQGRGVDYAGLDDAEITALIEEGAVA